MENLKLVLVGHVDHGKSTLIGRLFYDTDSLPEGKIEEIKSICDSLGREMEFGFIMDHLEEERKQGVTIDTAQTFFKTPKRHYTIIDAPGHIEFVKNMITGASQAEAAVLIVDAQEGVQEQTRRHAYILSMLGLQQVIVVMNKMDLIGYDQKRFEQVKSDLKEFLDKINISPSYIIPISAKEGDNIAKKSANLPWYKGLTVLESLDTFEPKKSNREKPLRLPVQDVYMFNGKRIIAGRVESGVLHPGDEIAVLPSGERTLVNSLEEFNREPAEAEAGKSIGLVSKDKVFIDRGDVIINVSDQPKVVDTIKANIFWMDKTPFHKGERLSFRCATQDVMCDIAEIEKVIDSSTLATVSENSDRIENRQVANVTIKTERPMVVENFNRIQELGRFILERNDTCAGGIITNV